jgi:membrane-bound ClpP family serine protease
VGVSAEWSLIITVLLALSFGWLLGRGTARVMRFVLAQQGTSVYASQDLIGAMGRVTIETPPGKTGEAMIEQDQVLKVAVREVNDAALHRGDHVEVIEVDGNILRVKKKRG